MMQIAWAMAGRLGWRLNDEESSDSRATQQQHVSLKRDRKLQLEKAIENLYGSQLPRSAFKWSVTPKVRAVSGHQSVCVLHCHGVVAQGASERPSHDAVCVLCSGATLRRRRPRRGRSTSRLLPWAGVLPLQHQT